MVDKSAKIYIAHSKIKMAGRGVFANADMQKGELIESCPVIQIPEDEASIINKTSLVNYIFYMGKKKNRMVIVLGFGSLYNHLRSANAFYKENSKAQTVDFIAKRDIKKGEEITVNYSPQAEAPLWFEV